MEYPKEQISLRQLRTMQATARKVARFLAAAGYQVESESVQSAMGKMSDDIGRRNAVHIGFLTVHGHYRGKGQLWLDTRMTEAKERATNAVNGTIRDAVRFG